jgi:hypothetical protein
MLPWNLQKDIGYVPCRYASTCQTVGMNIGYFSSFTVFLALNDADFCNKYLRGSPSADGHLTLAVYLRAWGWAYAVITLLIAALKREVNFPPLGTARPPHFVAVPGNLPPVL